MPGLWLILACADPVDAFLTDRADAVCARHARCDTLEASGFADEAACRDALEDAARTASAAACPDYDASAAEDCLAAYDVDCDAVPDVSVCDGVCR